MIKIKVPATSANMGPGFDSLGVAVSLFLDVDVLEETNDWIVEHDIPYLPHDARNLIVKTALRVSKNLKPHRLRMHTNIPTTRGLGSSSSAIVAGIELANYLGGLQLSIDQKIQLATKFEGHPDNVVPAIVGNMVTSAYVHNRVYWSKIKLYDTVLLVAIPDKPLSTRESRAVLPETLPLHVAATGSAVSNVLIAQIARGYTKNLKRLVESDVFHEPYRAHLVPEVQSVRDALKKEAVYGTYLSGAGPTVATLAPKHLAHKIEKIVSDLLPNHTIQVLKIHPKGVECLPLEAAEV